MNTHHFVASWAAKHIDGTTKRVLDYGCGAGEIVTLLRSMGIDAYGCDVYYGGGDYSASVPTALKEFVFRMSNGKIPFADGSIDLVVSNQVFEHVPDMEGTLSEIARVLRPGGTALNVFPDEGVWREGHCGVPFLHWFPKRSSLRVYYAAAARCIGLGVHKQGKGIMQWARDFCVWLDDWTYYRSITEITLQFNRLLGVTRHAEEDWLNARFSGRLDWLPLEFRRFGVRKAGGLVLVSKKPGI
jgi:SAM-dependent methyltransferase